VTSRRYREGASTTTMRLLQFTGNQRIPEDLRGRLRLDYLKEDGGSAHRAARPAAHRWLSTTPPISHAVMPSVPRGGSRGGLPRRFQGRDRRLHRVLVRLAIGRQCLAQGAVGRRKHRGGRRGPATRKMTARSRTAPSSSWPTKSSSTRPAGASDIHIEPYGKEDNTRIRFRIDGDCVRLPGHPPAFRNPLVGAFQDHGQAGHLRTAQAQDGKIKFRMRDRTNPSCASPLCPPSTETKMLFMRILAASKPIPLDEMGMSQRNLDEMRNCWPSPTACPCAWGPTGPARPPRCTRPLGSITPST